MQVGAIFPQTECGTDVAAIGEFVRVVEAMGYDHLFVADHVLGADPKFHSHPSLANYSHEAVVHEALTLIAYLAALHRRRGMGWGWNAVEYEPLNEPFDTRGRRAAEQVAVLRALWTQPVVEFRGEFHRISHAGLNPMPIQRPIPVWFGGGSREEAEAPHPALRRIGRLADGWSPNLTPDAQ